MHPDNERGRLNDHFEDAHAELPEHLGWETLGPGIVAAEEKPRRFFWWFWGGAAGAVVGILIALFWLPGLMNKVEMTSASTTAAAELRVTNTVSSFGPSEESSSAEVIRISEASSDHLGRRANRTNGLKLDLPGQSAKAPTLPLPFTARPASKTVEAWPKTASVRPAPAAAFPVLVSTVISPLPQKNPALPSPVIHLPSPPAPPLKTRTERTYDVALGATQTIKTSDKTIALPGPALQLGMTLPLGERKTKLAARLTYDRLDSRTDVFFTRNVNLYRPNTPDTLFRNAFTGEERLVTTDSVPGIRAFWNRQHQQTHLVGAEVSLVRRFTAGRWSVDLEAGLGGAVVLRREGSLLAEDGLPAPVESSNVRWSGHGSAALGYRASERLEFFVRGQYVLPFNRGWRPAVRAVAGVRYRTVRR